MHYWFSGAGKTYTMLGTEREPGIMVLTLNNLFTKIQDTSDDMIYRVTMAYMEVHYRNKSVSCIRTNNVILVMCSCWYKIGDKTS